MVQNFCGPMTKTAMRIKKKRHEKDELQDFKPLLVRFKLTFYFNKLFLRVD